MRRAFYSKNFLKMFFSFLFIVILMLVFTYMVFQNSMQGMYEQIKENSRLVVRNSIQSFDSSFKEVNIIFHTINTIKSGSRSIYTDDGYGNLNMYAIYQLRNSLSEVYSTCPDFIEEIILYFNDSDLAITSEGTISIEDLFSKRYSNEKYSPSFWRNFSNTKHPLTIIPSSIYINKMKFNNMGSYMAVVSSNMMGNLDMTTLILVDQAKLLRYNNYNNIMEGSSLIILDQSGNVILNIGEKSILEELNGIDFSNEDGYFKKHGYEFFIERSYYNDFTYIHALPVSYIDMFKAVKSNKYILRFNIIIGIIIALIFSLYLFNPTKEIVYLFEAPQGESIADEWLYIKTNIQNMQEEREFLNKKVADMEKGNRLLVFSRMLQSVEYDISLREQINLYFSEFYTDRKYALLLFDINFSNVSLRNILKKVEKELDSLFECSFASYLNGWQIAVLVGIPSDMKRSQLLDKITLLHSKLQCEAFTLTIGVSRLYSDPSNFKDAYEDVKDYTCFRGVQSKETIVDIENIGHKNEAYYPHNLNSKIFNLILSGNGDQCKLFIEEVLDENIKRDIQYIKYKNIVLNIFSNISGTLAYCGYDDEDVFEIERNFHRMLNGVDAATSQEIRWIIDTIVEQAVNKIKIREDDNLDKRFIVEYINLHYMEGLSLDSMADVVGTTPKYFSNYFKKEVGINFVDYLNQVRINHAKKYLRDTDLPIGEIGTKVGYLSPSTFTTTFRRYSGISPSEYRENMKSNSR